MNFKVFAFLLPALLIITSGDGVCQGSNSTQAIAKGYVYEDLNRNGKKDKGEKGISDVMVSNQREVVVTDGDGSYALPVAENTIITVSKPAGYKVLKNKNNLPQFYYAHMPNGSPDLKFDGFESTGPLPNPLNFALIPFEKEETFKAIVFGDPQPRNDKELSYFRDDIVSELANVDADVTLVLGDIMFNDLSLYGRYNRMMKTLGTPVFNIFGNHDINFDADGNKFARETFKKHYGPTYFSFEYGDVHFIALNNIDYLGRDSNSAPYRGYIDAKQLKWIENTVAHIDKDNLIVLLSHIPLYSDNGKSKTQNIVNRDELLQLFGDRPNLLYLSGHRHRIFQDFLDDEIDNITPNSLHHMALTAASGAWWSGPKDHRGIPVTLQRDGTPNGYHVFEFDGNTYKERYKGAGHPKDYQLRIERPKSSLSLQDYKKSEFLVNVFNGNERSKVLYRIGGKTEWKSMKQLNKAYSPYFNEVLEGKREAGHTDHFWTAELPDLKKGIHNIEVMTEDMYGRQYRETKLIEIK